MSKNWRKMTVGRNWIKRWQCLGPWWWGSLGRSVKEKLISSSIFDILSLLSCLDIQEEALSRQVKKASGVQGERQVWRCTCGLSAGRWYWRLWDGRNPLGLELWQRGWSPQGNNSWAQEEVGRASMGVRDEVTNGQRGKAGGCGALKTRNRILKMRKMSANTRCC